MYSEGRPTEETKRAYGGMEERGERAREEVQARAFEYEENLSVIRETLYSGMSSLSLLCLSNIRSADQPPLCDIAFADAIVDTPSILELLARGTDYAPRAFFASTCLAILEVALSRVGTDGVRVVQMGRGAPKVIGINETPGQSKSLPQTGSFTLNLILVDSVDSSPSAIPRQADRALSSLTSTLSSRRRIRDSRSFLGNHDHFLYSTDSEASRSFSERGIDRGTRKGGYERGSRIENARKCD